MSSMRAMALGSSNSSGSESSAASPAPAPCSAFSLVPVDAPNALGEGAALSSTLDESSPPAALSLTRSRPAVKTLDVGRCPIAGAASPDPTHLLARLVAASSFRVAARAATWLQRAETLDRRGACRCWRAISLQSAAVVLVSVPDFRRNEPSPNETCSLECWRFSLVVCFSTAQWFIAVPGAALEYAHALGNTEGAAGGDPGGDAGGVGGDCTGSCSSLRMGSIAARTVGWRRSGAASPSARKSSRACKLTESSIRSRARAR